MSNRVANRNIRNQVMVVSARRGTVTCLLTWARHRELIQRVQFLGSPKAKWKEAP